MTIPGTPSQQYYSIAPVGSIPILNNIEIKKRIGQGSYGEGIRIENL